MLSLAPCTGMLPQTCLLSLTMHLVYMLSAFRILVTCHIRTQARYPTAPCIKSCARYAFQAWGCGNDLEVDDGEAAEAVSVAEAADAS